CPPATTIISRCKDARIYRRELAHCDTIRSSKKISCWISAKNIQILVENPGLAYQGQRILSVSSTERYSCIKLTTMLRMKLQGIEHDFGQPGVRPRTGL